MIRGLFRVASLLLIDCLVVWLSGLQGTYVEEGDPEDDEAEIKLTWRGGPMVASSQSAADLARVPLVLKA